MKTNILKNTWLCIKYPFLYPRNRFTGKHYTNWKLDDIIQDTERRNNPVFFVDTIAKEELDNMRIACKTEKKYTVSKQVDFYGCAMTTYKTDGNIMVLAYRDGKSKKIAIGLDTVLPESLTPDDVCSVYFQRWFIPSRDGKQVINVRILIVLKEGRKLKNTIYKFPSVNIELNKNYKIKVKLLNFLNSCLSIFHCIPTYTELDDLDKGWRIRFGKDICREIRNSLLMTYIREEKPTTIIGKIKSLYKGVKLLYNYRILQIKEKYAQLRWYDAGNTKDVHDIINKYTILSENTCIVCGEDAKYLSTGWVCPYCEEHKPKGSVEIGKQCDDEMREL